MFVQIITGRVGDAAGIRKQMDRWMEECRPGAIGWLGSTAGITDDGTFIAAARFESPDAARRNSDRAEQGKWWQETSQHLDGDPTFYNCSRVTEILSGGSDDAGFVQFIRGSATDRNRVAELWRSLEKTLPERRPDLLGGIAAWHDDEVSAWTQVMYFTSEAEARAREGQEPPDEIRAVRDEIGSLTTSMEYFDVKQPLLYST